MSEGWPYHENDVSDYWSRRDDERETLEKKADEDDGEEYGDE